MNTLVAEHVPLPESRSSPLSPDVEIDPHDRLLQVEDNQSQTQPHSLVEKPQTHDSQDEVDETIGNGSQRVDEEKSQDRSEEVLEAKREEAGSLGNPHPPNPLIRVPTPSSRTSTPPLGAVASAKKFSSININKKFLNKTASPSAGSPAIGAKLGLSASSPVPITSASSRLLSTKLTTVPSSTSPQPPGSSNTSTSGTSPWAKPALPLAVEPTVETSSTPIGTLHHPAPTRARVLSSTPTAVMGSGQGIGGFTPKTAWKAVAAEGKRAPVGLSRDFPTAKEVAESKRAQQMAAQAQADHNQAILQGLNAFTQLDPSTHHWDDEDEDDDIIDFGDGVIHPHPDGRLALASAIAHDVPVSKSERFVEDFDRSWPRQQPPPVQVSSSHSTILPRRSDTDRVLFNANSNRLETPRQPLAQQQPTRLMTRLEPATSGRTFDRPLPPHLQGGLPEEGRMLPPHMTAQAHPNPPVHSSSTENRPTAQPAPATGSGRQSWGVQRDDRPAAAPPAGRQELPTQSSTFANSQSSSSCPPERRSFSQAGPPIVLPSPSHSAEAETAGQHPTVPPVDDQAVEMHNAAEKARLRRLAEEQEREAAAERARRKAKELEEKYGLKVTTLKVTEAAAPQAAPPGLTKLGPGPVFTLAQRPQPQPEKVDAQSGTPTKNLPPRPPNELRGEGSWRNRVPETKADLSHQGESRAVATTAPHAVSTAFAPSAPMLSTESLPPYAAEAPAKERNFDNMLARLQAAMVEARAPEPLSPEPTTVQPVLPKFPESSPHLPNTTNVEPTTATHPVSPHLRYFDVTQPDLPRSPPPAWRTYNVRLPKTSLPKRSVPVWRLQAFDAPRKKTSKAFIMSFEPPIEHLSSATLSRSDLLLSPSSRSFPSMDIPSPIVSISPRRFEPYTKRPKKRAAYEGPRSSEFLQPITSAESLLPSSSTRASAQLRSQIASTSEHRWNESSDAVSLDQSRKPRSPVKTSVAANAERDGLFIADGVGISASERKRSLSDLKPGVRFMVSSELDGDSLLDEVNKMSLETLGEGDDKTGSQDVGDAKTTGSETPKTPPSHSGTSSRGHASSPIGVTSTPWAKTSSRSSSQHDHLKSVWEQTPTAAADNSARVTDAFAAPITPSAPLSNDATTPMYPSLNAPSSADPPAAQPLPTAMKMAYSQAQTFSPTGVSPNFAPVRQSPATYGYANTEQHVAYQRTGNVAGATNGGYGAQQGVWSPSAFGTGYGYSKPTQSIGSVDAKAAMAFNAAPNKGGSSYPNANIGDYRYAGNHASFGAYQSQPSSSSYGQSPYGRHAVTSPPANLYGYGYGAPGSQSNARGRFSTANGTDHQYSGNGMEGGYYGGVGVNQQQQQQHQQQAYGYGGHGAVGQHQNQASRAAATAPNTTASSGQRTWGQQ